MCKLCDDYNNKILTPKQIFIKIGRELLNDKIFDKGKALHLGELSQKIMDDEIPFEDTFSDETVQYDNDQE